MNLLRSICCLFGSRCEGEEPKPTKDTMRDKPPADLGPKEAELEKTGKEQMGHMELRRQQNCSAAHQTWH
jgi:hypothetical protein